MLQADLVVVGAGPVGCVIAERAVSQRGWSVLLIDRRNHLAGNCHDRFHDSGLLVHQYGPHYFRTQREALVDYLSQFTDWVEGNYIVKSFSQGALYPFPINLDTLEQFFGEKLTAARAQTLLAQVAQTYDQAPQNSEEFVLSRVGQALYEAFYLGYTCKQWGQHPRQLSASVCGRIPIRLNRDPRYVEHRFQLTPKAGFTAMFARMVHNPKVRLLLQCDWRDIRAEVKARVATVYCGPVDEYFDGDLGPLPWRSLAFDFRAFSEPFRQPCVQINYPNDFSYTRSVEIKHVTRQVHPHTVVAYEYPRAHGEPYYPVPAAANQALYARYAERAAAETRDRRVFFAGRLAQYRYINTDEAIEGALETFNAISQAEAA